MDDSIYGKDELLWALSLWETNLKSAHSPLQYGTSTPRTGPHRYMWADAWKVTRWLPLLHHLYSHPMEPWLDLFLVIPVWNETQKESEKNLGGLLNSRKYLKKKLWRKLQRILERIWYIDQLMVHHCWRLYSKIGSSSQIPPLQLQILHWKLWIMLEEMEIHAVLKITSEFSISLLLWTFHGASAQIKAGILKMKPLSRGNYIALHTIPSLFYTVKNPS